MKNGPLADKVADKTSELNGVIPRGFEGITDIEVGLYDGYLYVLSHRGGSIDRIIPNDKPINEN